MNRQRACLGYQHIYTHVPLVTSDQQWVCDVLLDDTLLIVDQLAYI